MQRKSWVFSHPVTCPDISLALQDSNDAGLVVEERYSTCLDGKRLVLMYMDRRVRHGTVETLLLRCGATDFELYGLDIANRGATDGGMAQQWYSIIQRHFAEGDARASFWLRPGKVVPVLVSVRLPATGAVSPAPCPGGEGAGGGAKRQRVAGGEAARDGEENPLLIHYTRLLAEKDARLDEALVEKERRFEALLAERDAQHAMAIAAKDDALRSAVERAELAERRAAGAETRLASIEAALRAEGGEARPGSVLLEIDLTYEKQAVAALTAQLEGAADTLRAKDARLLEIERRCSERVCELESDMRALRSEAALWACDRERRARELEDKDRRLATATAEVHRLQAECGAKDALVADLRGGALKIVEAEMERERLDRESSAKAMAEMAKKEDRFKEATWQRKSALLHKEIEALKAQLRCYVANDGRE